MITLLDILVVAAVLGCAYWGWRVGLETASVAGLEVVACLAIAVLLHETVASWLLAAAGFVLGDWASQAWSVLLAFASLAWGSFAAVRLRLHRKTGDEEESEIDPLADRLCGAVAGGFGGAIFAGGVLVTLSMVPFLAGLKPSGDRLLLDLGKTALRAAGQFALERHEGRRLPLDGEAPSRLSDASASLTSEPWFDADGDGSQSEADRFRDVDGNGIFTKDLYFTDADADGLRRVGLMDKYVAGRWDAALVSNDRRRPPAAKPEPAKPEPAKPEPTKPEPAKPEPTKPEPAKPEPAKPEPAKPEPAKPEPTKPEGKRPDDDF